MDGRDLIGTLRHDWRYALRVLWKSRVFTLVTVLTLALGVGANTAMFSVINAVLLHPLPYPHPAQLVRLAQSANQDAITMIEFNFWKEHSEAFSLVAGYRGITERYLTAGQTQQWISAMPVTANFFHVIGTSPMIGREFSSLEVRTGGPQAVILTYRAWQDLFKSDPGVLGRIIRLDTASYAIVGVLPREYWFPLNADVLVALQSTGGIEDRGSNTSVIARLKDRTSLSQAQAESAKVTENFRSAYMGRIPAKYRGLIVVSYQDWLVGNVRVSLLLLFGTTGFLFLMACSNLASLLLARLAAREKEIAVRLALGSSNARLLRQFLIENMLLSLGGLAAGILVGYGLLRGLISLLPFHLPTSMPLGIDRAVLGFAVVLFVILTLAFTLVPAISATRLNVQEALKVVGQVAGMGTSHQRMRNFLVVGQVAVSTMLLITAGLLIQSLYRLHQEQLGFRSNGVLTFSTSLAPVRYPTADSAWRFATTITDRIQALQGVHGVAAINVLPLTGGINLPSEHDGHPEQSIGGMEIRLVTPEYFKVMGIPLEQGRPFNQTDSATSAPVAIVNETLARQWWPDGRALGDRMIIGRFQQKDYPEIRDNPREIVGVAGDTKTVNLRDFPRPTVFVPLPQSKDGYIGMTGKLAWIVKVDNTTGIPQQLRQIIGEFDPTQRIQDLRAMDEIVASATANSRFDAWLFGTFAGLALILAAIGVHGLLAFSVAYRRQEIGTRMALGASRANVLWFFLKQGFILTAIGLGLGLPGAFFLTHSLASLLYGIKPNDPLSFFTVSLVLLLVGVAASYIPSFRATRIDPTVTLRYE